MRASPARRALLDAAKAERKVLNAWVRGGRLGLRPPTPALETLKAEHYEQARR